MAKAAKARLVRWAVLPLLLLAAVTLAHPGPPTASAAHIDPVLVNTIFPSPAPWNVAVNPVTNRIYIVHKQALPITPLEVIDGASNAIIATVVLPGGGNRPFGIGVNPVTNRIYVANKDFTDVAVIDGDTNTIIGSVPGTTGAQHVAVNPLTNRIYVASGTVKVIDGATNTVTASIPLGGFSADGVAVNPVTNRIYATGRNVAVTSVIDGDTNAVIGTMPAAGDIAVNPQTNRVYAFFGLDLVVIDGATNALIATVPNPGFSGLAVNPTTNRIYVADGNNDRVSVIDGTTNTVVATVAVGVETIPVAVAVNPSTDLAYVANIGSYDVSVIGTSAIGSDRDGDGVGDALDNCPAWPNATQALPPWPVPADDPDCDGFSTSVETFGGTIPWRACGVISWRPDFDDSRTVDIVDVLRMKPTFGRNSPQQDLDASGGPINIVDVLKMKPFFGKACSP